MADSFMTYKSTTLPAPDIWTAADCADFLRISYSSFIKKYQYKPGFPARLSNFDSPRWSAESVRAWALDKLAA